MFIHDFLRNVIQDHMEDSKQRDEFWHKYLSDKRRIADKLVLIWRQPTKSFGFWNREAVNSKYSVNMDPAVKRLPGRVPPIDS